MTDRDRFLRTIRRALGRSRDSGPLQVADVTALSRDGESVRSRAATVAEEAKAPDATLTGELAESAAAIGWQVFRAGSAEEATGRIADIARDAGAGLVMRSAHSILSELSIDEAASAAGAEVEIAAADDGISEADAAEERLRLRERLLVADVGITGVDYAIAETGSCVIMARRGVSRLVSLLPPVHVAVVRTDQVLPSLDELFTLRRATHLAGDPLGYMNIISGPSRSADIEQTLIHGMHGPREAHMVLLG